VVEGGAPRSEPSLARTGFHPRQGQNVRRGMTQPEKTHWSLLRRNQSRLHFRRQHPIGPFVLDFYCASLKLAVEVDGPVHDDRQESDDRRTAWLAEKEGIRVLRFSAADVETRSAEVLRTIAQAAAPSTGFAGPPPP
jgi:very-short-patch-repair endonuclease